MRCNVCGKKETKDDLLIGRCFKIQRNFRGSDKWDVYFKVLSKKIEDMFYVLSFETDCFGKTSIEYMATRIVILQDIYYNEISEEQFDTEFFNTLSIVSCHSKENT